MDERNILRSAVGGIVALVICAVLGCGGSGNGIIEPPLHLTPFPLCEGCRWSYVRIINGLPLAETLDVKVLGIDSLPDSTPVFIIDNSWVTPYAHVTGDAIEWYLDVADNEPECTWQVPFVAGAELDDCRPGSMGLFFRRVIVQEDCPGPNSTFKNCWKLEVDLISAHFLGGLLVVDTAQGHAWLAEGVGLVEVAVDSVLYPPGGQLVSLELRLVDYEVGL